MKNKIAKWLSLVVIAIFFAGCSDGELDMGATKAAFNISEPAPQIVSFKADPMKVPYQGSTTLTWQVVDATEVTITSDAGYNFGPMKELKGTVKVDGLVKEKIEFTLTATKPAAAAATEKKKEEAKKAADAPKPAATDSKPKVLTSKAKVIVEVEQPVQLEVTVDADNKKVASGMTTILRWEVKPAEKVGEVTVSDAEGTVSPTFDYELCKDITTTDKLLQMQPSEKTPVKGCAVVGAGVYTVTASEKDAKDKVVKAEVMIAEEMIDIQAQIFVDGKDELKVDALPAHVTVTWNVVPQNAIVIITATPNAECDPALPTGDTILPQANDDNTDDGGDQSIDVTLNNMAKCHIIENTVFELTAVYGASTKTVQAKAYQAVDGLAGDIKVEVKDQWAFVGDKVKVKISPIGQVDKVMVIDNKAVESIIFKADRAAVEKELVVPEAGIRLQVVSNGKESEPEKVVEAMKTNVGRAIANDKEVAITKIAFSNVVNSDKSVTQIPYVGTELKVLDDKGEVVKENLGKIRFYGNNNRYELDFKQAYPQNVTGKAKFDNIDRFHKTYGGLPVTALSIRAGKPEQLYISSSGFVSVSNDSGKTWTTILQVGEYTTNSEADKKYKDGYDGTFDTCRGGKRKGLAKENLVTWGDWYRENQVVGLSRGCDIIANKNGSLIVALDAAILRVENVDELLKAKVEDQYKLWSVTKTYVNASDLYCVDGEETCAKVLAATDKGVLLSEDNGKTWKDLGNIGKKAYAVQDMNGTVIAGTSEGMYVYADSKWSAAQGADLNKVAVYSLAADPIKTNAMRTVVAGTSQGVYVSRDNGLNWSRVEDPKLKDSKDVYSVALTATATQISSDLSQVNYQFMTGNSASELTGTVSVLAGEKPQVTVKKEDEKKEEPKKEEPKKDA